MKDPEFIMLRNRVLIGIFISIIFIISICFFIKNKLLVTESDLEKSIKNKEDILILFTEENCSKCKSYEKKLIDLNVNYFILNKNKEKNYKTILYKIETSNDELIPPTLIYVREGKVYSTLVDIKSKKELEKYLKNYRLIN